MYLLVHSYLSIVAQKDMERIFCEEVEKTGSWRAWMEMERIRELIDDLATSPHHGDCRDDIWLGVLSIRHEDFVIYFRRNSSQLGVDILAVGSLADDPKYSQTLTEFSREIVRTERDNMQV